MTPDTIFMITCSIAAIAWIVLLLISPFWTGYDKFVVSIIIAILALCYTWLNFSNFDPGLLKKFSSLEGISELFQNKFLLAAGWIHFLAFDLLAAVWIKRNSVMHNIGHGFVIPSLFFTCMLGPLGFLLYLLTRWIKTKKYFTENFN